MSAQVGSKQAGQLMQMARTLTSMHMVLQDDDLYSGYDDGVSSQVRRIWFIQQPPCLAAGSR
jgi:hypothetical protein